MQTASNEFHLKGEAIALVPTMGSLHEGHLSLIRKAREKADRLVVSIFVNPSQFGPNEDYEEYPRDEDLDAHKCKDIGVDILFLPSEKSIYPPFYSSYVDENNISATLCGISRPNHFRGVATVCLKLFNIIRPNYSYFGQKDAQQCALIKKIVKDFNIQTKVCVGDTIRDSDGLAMSSRNAYLSDLQRAEAVFIFKSLNRAKELVENGVINVDRVIAEITHILSKKRRIRVIYVQVVDKETMQLSSKIYPGKSLACVAVWLDSIRLIDNITL